MIFGACATAGAFCLTLFAENADHQRTTELYEFATGPQCMIAMSSLTDRETGKPRMPIQWMACGEITGGEKR